MATRGDGRPPVAAVVSARGTVGRVLAEALAAGGLRLLPDGPVTDPAELADALPDVAVLDLDGLDGDPQHAAHLVAATAEAVPAVALVGASEHLGSPRDLRALAAGLVALVAPTAGAAELAAVARGAARRQATLPPGAAAAVLAELAPVAGPGALTATESEVLRLLADGVGAAGIAERYDVAERLVQLHAGFAVAKLHRRARAAASGAIEAEPAPTPSAVEGAHLLR